jgi:energy-coupling factor transporter ATP-binding protein EcfA2
MQLLKMELRGFKSFADKTTLTFDKGITAIVGPNGSGKSNISDAVRWVMGEQNIRQLRGQKSESLPGPRPAGPRGPRKSRYTSTTATTPWIQSSQKSSSRGAFSGPVTVNTISTAGRAA